MLVVKAKAYYVQYKCTYCTMGMVATYLYEYILYFRTSNKKIYYVVRDYWYIKYITVYGLVGSDVGGKG